MSVRSSPAKVMLSAPNGQEGLACFRAHAGEIDLVLTEVVLPVLSGPAMVMELIEENPSLKVLFMSAAYCAAATSKTEQKRFAVVVKPFTVHGLAAAVRKCFLAEIPPATP